MKIPVFGLLFLFVVISSAHAALPVDAIGRIQTFQGTASIIRGTVTFAAATGIPLSRGDLIRTGKPGAVGIVLTDDTTISIGPNSELSLNEYLFEPKEGKFSLVARMFKGTFSYLSGLIGKLSPGSVRLVIPDATIAVRGTKLLVDVQE